MVWMPYGYQMGIFVTQLPIEITWQKIPRYLIHYLFAYLLMVVYNILILRRRGIKIFKFNFVFLIALSQPVANLSKRVRRPAAFLYVAGSLLFYFIVAIFYMSEIIVFYLSYTPDRSIKTLEDIKEHRIPLKILTNCHMWQLDDLADVSVSNSSVFIVPVTDIKIAYAVEVYMPELFNVILKSPSNINEEEQERFYKLDHFYHFKPVLHILPRNSPFTESLRKVYIHMHEAALANRWMMEEMHNNHKEFRFFAQHLEFSKLEPKVLSFRQVKAAFVMMFIGFTASFLVLGGEILMHRYKEMKKRNRQEIEVEKQRQKVLQGVMEFYHYLIEDV